ncbi:MAG: conjugal transfer protein TraR [Methylobacter sp.]
MTYIIDQANDYAEKERQIAIANRIPFTLDAGKPGDCDFCGKWFGRLVDGACVPCRDKYEKQGVKHARI